MRYSEYLTIVLRQYKKYPRNLICQTNQNVYEDYGYESYYNTLQDSIYKTFYNERRIRGGIVLSTFSHMFLNFRKPNSHIRRKFEMYNKDRCLGAFNNYKYAIRFRTKYLEQLIRQAKIAEIPQSSEIDDLTNHNVIYYPDSESWLRIAEKLSPTSPLIANHVGYSYGNSDIWRLLLEYKIIHKDKQTYDMTQDESIYLALILAAIQGEI